MQKYVSYNDLITHAKVCVIWLQQEKAYVTGLEAANYVIDYFGEGELAKIIPVEEDEVHVRELRRLNSVLKELQSRLPFSGFFMWSLV